MSRQRNMQLRIISLIVLSLVAVACGATDDVGGGSSTTIDPTTTTTTIAPPDVFTGDPDRLVLQITDEGGFAPIELIVNRLPRFSVYADGTLLAPAPVPAIYPGPMLLPLQSVPLSDADLVALMEAIEAFGLPGIDRDIDDILNGLVADATTTIATFIDGDGAEHVYGAYALGLIGDEPPPERTQKLGELVELLDGFLANPGGVAFEPDRIQVWINETPDVDPDFSQTVTWPLDITPADFEPEGDFQLGCHVLAGDPAQAAIAAFNAANQATVWDFEGTEYQLIVRILLPSEPGCIP
jgi:hypothetical protein